MLDGLHLWNRGDGALEILKADPALGRQFDAKKDRDPKAQAFGVQDNSASGNDAALFEAANAPPCSGLRQAQCPPQCASALGGVLLQGAQKGVVCGIERDQTGRPSLDLIRATCISASISAICGKVSKRSRQICW